MLLKKHCEILILHSLQIEELIDRKVQVSAREREFTYFDNVLIFEDTLECILQLHSMVDKQFGPAS